MEGGVGEGSWLGTGLLEFNQRIGDIHIEAALHEKLQLTKVNLWLW